MPPAELPTERPDVVYLDPMFPPRTKSSLVKKDMQLLHRLLHAGATPAPTTTSNGVDGADGAVRREDVEDGSGGASGGATGKEGGEGEGEGGVEGGVEGDSGEGDSGEGDSGEGDGSALEKELAMLNRAREYALRRTVVKRPKNAPPLGNAPPSHSVEGSTNRFDVYLA